MKFIVTLERIERYDVEVDVPDDVPCPSIRAGRYAKQALDNGSASMYDEEVTVMDVMTPERYRERFGE